MKQTDRIKINEIRIYYSFWKNMLMAIGCLAFAACGWLMIHDIHITRPSKVYIGIAGMVFFGGCGIFLLGQTLYQRIRRIPFLIIYDDRLDIYEWRNGTYRTIYFREVECFRLIKIYKSKLIAIDYKETPMKEKMEEASCFTQHMMEFNARVSRALESFPTENLTIKGKAICDILNARLKK